MEPEDLLKLSPAEIERHLPEQHPATYYLYASRLWGEGRRDEAAFWFYAGQLRFRFYLGANPTLERSGDPALFASLQATLGEPINLYVGGNTKNWLSLIERVLAWDAKTTNGFTSTKTHEEEWKSVREGLTKFHDYVAKNQAEIQRQREEQGIGEIGLVKGVYVEERRQKMPRDWPALAQRTTLEMLAGSYTNDFDTLLGATLLPDATPEANRATTVVLSATANGELLAVAKKDGHELLRRAIKVRLQDGAVVFERVREGEQAGLEDGRERATVFLRLNAAGELVLQRDNLVEGRYAGKTNPVRLSYRFWNRAKRLEGDGQKQD